MARGRKYRARAVNSERQLRRYSVLFACFISRRRHDFRRVSAHMPRDARFPAAFLLYEPLLTLMATRAQSARMRTAARRPENYHYYGQSRR